MIIMQKVSTGGAGEGERVYLIKMGRVIEKGTDWTVMLIADA